MDDRVFAGGVCTRVCAACGDVYDDPEGSVFTVIAVCESCSLVASPHGSDETGTGGVGVAVHGDRPSGPQPPWRIFQTPCRPGQCVICDDRRDRQWSYMEDPF